MTQHPNPLPADVLRLRAQPSTDDCCNGEEAAPGPFEPVYLAGHQYLGPVAESAHIISTGLVAVGGLLRRTPLSPEGLRTWVLLSGEIEHAAGDLRDLLIYLQDLEEVERHP